MSFPTFEELRDTSRPLYSSRESLTLDKRINYFPTADLLVTIPATRDQLVLRKLDVVAAMEKSGIDYLYVASLPPAAVAQALGFADQAHFIKRFKQFTGVTPSRLGYRPGTASRRPGAARAGQPTSPA